MEGSVCHHFLKSWTKVNPFLTTVYAHLDEHFQQDSISCHKARILTECSKNITASLHCFSGLHRLRLSPHLSICGMRWKRLLCNAVIAAWCSVAAQHVQHLVHSVPRQIHAVSKAKASMLLEMCVINYLVYLSLLLNQPCCARSILKLWENVLSLFLFLEIQGMIFMIMRYKRIRKA